MGYLFLIFLWKIYYEVYTNLASFEEKRMSLTFLTSNSSSIDLTVIAYFSLSFSMTGTQFMLLKTTLRAFICSLIGFPILFRKFVYSVEEQVGEIQLATKQ